MLCFNNGRNLRIFDFKIELLRVMLVILSAQLIRVAIRHYILILSYRHASLDRLTFVVSDRSRLLL